MINLYNFLFLVNITPYICKIENNICYLYLQYFDAHNIVTVTTDKLIHQMTDNSDYVICVDNNNTPKYKIYWGEIHQMYSKGVEIYEQSI